MQVVALGVHCAIDKYGNGNIPAQDGIHVFKQKFRPRIDLIIAGYGRGKGSGCTRRNVYREFILLVITAEKSEIIVEFNRSLH